MPVLLLSLLQLHSLLCHALLIYSIGFAISYSLYLHTQLLPPYYHSALLLTPWIYDLSLPCRFLLPIQSATVLNDYCLLLTVQFYLFLFHWNPRLVRDPNMLHKYFLLRILQNHQFPQLTITLYVFKFLRNILTSLLFLHIAPVMPILQFADQIFQFLQSVLHMKPYIHSILRDIMQKDPVALTISNEHPSTYSGYRDAHVVSIMH